MDDLQIDDILDVPVESSNPKAVNGKTYLEFPKRVSRHPEAVTDKEFANRDSKYMTGEVVDETMQLIQVQNQELASKLAQPLENDLLYQNVRRGRSTLTLLNQILEEIAEEAAILKAWRKDNMTEKDNQSDTAIKRIKMLREMVEALSEREKLKDTKGGAKIDFQGEGFQRVFEYFVKLIQKAFKEVNIPKQYEDMFITQLAKEFDGFEKKAEKIYFGKDIK